MADDRRLRINLLEHEKQIITAQATLLGMSESGYIRMKVFAPALDTSIHLSDRMHATSEIGLAVNSVRRLEVKLQELMELAAIDDPMLATITWEMNRLKGNLAVAYQHLAQVNPYAG